MIPFDLRSPETGEPLKADTPHSLREAESGARWPVIDGIPYLRTNRADLVAQTLKRLDAGEADLTLLEAHWNNPVCVFEFACGIGHYLREFQTRGIKVAGADVVFAKLWVARHWVVGKSAQLVCFDAHSPHWPIPDAPVDLVVCNDAFYFLDRKAEVLECLRQNAGDDGWLAVSHIHNSDRPGFSAGRAVSELLMGKKALSTLDSNWDDLIVVNKVVVIQIFLGQRIYVT